MTDSLNNVTIYLDDERLAKTAAIVAELSRRAGLKISRSAAVGRAIDDLFLAVCPVDLTNDRSAEQPTDIAA